MYKLDISTDANAEKGEQPPGDENQQTREKRPDIGRRREGISQSGKRITGRGEADGDDRLTDDEGGLVGEVVGRNLQVQGSGALADAARDVVVRTVAGAEPTAKVAGLADGDTAEVGADTNHDEPLGLLDTVRVRLGITEGLPGHRLGLLDLLGGPVTDEDGLAAPLEDDLLEVNMSVMLFRCIYIRVPAGEPTFLPSGTVLKSSSTLAMARTSAEADMFIKKSTRN